MFSKYYVGKYDRVMTLSPEQAADEELEAVPYDPAKHDEKVTAPKAAGGGAGDKPRGGTFLPGDPKSKD